jgi:heptosyltransferase III
LAGVSLKIDPARVKRVLIYKLGSLGDTVVTLPALHVVEQAFPQAQRLMLTNIPVNSKAPSAAAILGDSELVNGYIEYPLQMRRVREVARVLWRIRRFRPDVLVYLPPQRSSSDIARDLRFFRFCGIHSIVGLLDGESAKNRSLGNGWWEAEASRFLRAVQVLGEADVNDLRNWDLRLTQKEHETARTALAPLAPRPMIACGPGTKWPSKDWGQENWHGLMCRLRETFPQHGLAIVGAAEEASVGEYAAQAWRGAAVNLCGKITPRETAAVLSHAELFLGPDSGPMHLAAIQGVPCAIPFAAIDLRGRWFPIGTQHRPIYHEVQCAGCLLEVCVEMKKKCTTSIGIDEMFAAAMQAWKNGRRKLDAVR